MASLTFEAKKQKLTEEVVLGKIYLQLADGIAKTDPVVLEAAPTFFEVTVHGCFTLALIHAARLFENREDSLGISSLIRTAKNEPRFFQNPPRLKDALIKIDQEIVPMLSSTLGRIKKLRDKVLAHSDLKALKDIHAFDNENAIGKSELLQVYDAAGEIINLLGRSYDDTDQVFELIGHDDFERALDLIADALCAQARDTERNYGVTVDFDLPAKCK